jgi:HEPN domain-containing protein
MKQTAVEWLENQIKKSKYFYKLMEDINSRSTVAQSNIFDQAKAMEKEQIIDTYWASYNEGKYSGDKTAEEYYKQTFKQE